MENLSNNIPDKIYIPRTNMEVENHLEEFWVGHKTFDSDIEYTRTDALIEKAMDYIANNMQCNGYTLQTKGKFIRDFKKYMED